MRTSDSLNRIGQQRASFFRKTQGDQLANHQECQKSRRWIPIPDSVGSTSISSYTQGVGTQSVSISIPANSFGRCKKRAGGNLEKYPEFMIASIHADRLFLGTLIRWRFTQGFTDGTNPIAKFTPVLGHQLAHRRALVGKPEDFSILAERNAAYALCPRSQVFSGIPIPPAKTPELHVGSL